MNQLDRAFEELKKIDKDDDHGVFFIGYTDPGEDKRPYVTKVLKGDIKMLKLVICNTMFTDPIFHEIIQDSLEIYENYLFLEQQKKNEIN